MILLCCAFVLEGNNYVFAVDLPWEKDKQTNKGKKSQGESSGSVSTKKGKIAAPGNSAGQGSTPAAIPLDNALVMGNRNAPLKVIVFTDPDCIHCARLHKEMKMVVQERNDIVFFLKLYPLISLLTSHKEEYWKSKSIVCNNSVELLEDIFNKKTISNNDCETSEIDDNIELAKALGITSVPTMIFANGKKGIGYKASDIIIRLIEENKAD
jgi:protein-disulfide isomerase